MRSLDLAHRLLLELVKRARLHSRRSTFLDYDAALASCNGVGYDAAAIADVVCRKTAHLARTFSRCTADRFFGPETRVGVPLTILVAQRAGGGSDAVNVLDFGGAAGAHYFYAKAVLPEVKLRWCVVETEAMAARAKDLANENLLFVTDLADATSWLGSIHLLHCSSVLQYVSDPIRLLDRLLECNARVAGFPRLPLTEGESFSLIQVSRLSENGPGPLPKGGRDKLVSYPVTILNGDVFEKHLTRKYTIAARYLDGGGVYETPRGLIPGFGYLALRR